MNESIVKIFENLITKYFEFLLDSYTKEANKILPPEMAMTRECALVDLMVVTHGVKNMCSQELYRIFEKNNPALSVSNRGVDISNLVCDAEDLANEASGGWLSQEVRTKLADEVLAELSSLADELDRKAAQDAVLKTAAINHARRVGPQDFN